MNIAFPALPKFITRLAIAGALGASVFGGAIVAPAFVAPSAFAQAVDLNAPQVPGFADVVEAVSPAVVSVRVEGGFQNASREPDHRGSRRDFRFDRRFFEDHGNSPEYERDKRRSKRGKRGRRSGMSQGSGFFVSDDGYIVTNNHVIARGAKMGSKITVVLEDGTELNASVVGADKRSDLAVLKVEADRKFTYVDFSEKTPRIGDWVVAVGNPFGLGGTVTAGIISANGRQIRASRYDDFIQIDAAVNKGNSGGPAFNLSGKVVGVNTAIFSPSGGNVGIAFAIPASLASEIVDDLINDGQVMRGWLGVQIQPVTKDIADSIGLADANGAIVAGAQDDSPAKAAGIKPGDVITAINGNIIKGPRGLAKEITNLSPDTDITVTLWSDGATKDVTVRLGQLREQATAPGARTSPALKSLARIGLELQSTTDGIGVEVVDVVPGSRAAKRGIRPGDVILTINGEEVTSPQKVLEIVRQVRELNRKAALFQLERNGANRFIAIPLRRG